MDKKERELLESIIWLINFLKEDIQVDRYKKDRTINDIELIQEKLNELYK